MSLIENFYDLQRYVKTCADRADLQVVWGEPTDTPSTNGKSIIIPRVNESFDDARLLRTKYSVAHEVAHCIYTSFDAAKDKAIDMNSKFGLVWNILEDHRIDYLNSMVYAGDYALCKSTYKSAYETMDLSKCDDVQLRAAIIGNIMLCNTWQPDLIDVGNALYAAAPDDVQQEIDRFIDVCSDLIDQARNMEDKHGTYLTYEATLAFLGTEEEKKAQEQKSVSEADGEGSGSKMSDEEADALKEAAKGMVSKPDMGDKEGDDNADGEVDDDYDSYTPDPMSELLIEDFPARKFSNLDPNSIDHHTVGFINKHIKNAGGMANKLRTKLQILSRSRTKYGTKSGKLHANALHRICIPDGGEYSERIFKRKENALDLDVAVTVLMDMSGSMFGCKYEHAALATTLLNESLGTVLRVPLELLGFTESYVSDKRSGGYVYKTHMVVLKNFNNPMPRQQLVNALGACEKILCENTDGEAILFAHDRLLRQRAKRKVLFVLSDGAPCGGRAKGSISTFTSHVIEHIQQRSPVEIYGIGLLDDSVTLYYKENAIINNVNEIESKLVSVITKKVFGV